MAYLYEQVENTDALADAPCFGDDAKFEVSFMAPDGLQCVDSYHELRESAVARVSYLNGGLDREFKEQVLKLMQGFADAYLRANGALDGIGGLYDSRASNPRCVHGKLSTEECLLCALPAGAPVNGWVELEWDALSANRCNWFHAGNGTRCSLVVGHSLEHL